MTQYVLLCDSAQLSFIDGLPVCGDEFGSNAWQLVDASFFSAFPLSDLSIAETSSLMAATAAFLAVCWAGRTLVRSAFHSGND